MDIDLTNEPLGSDPDGTPVYLRDIWPTDQEIAGGHRARSRREMFPATTPTSSPATSAGRRCRRRRATRSSGTDSSTYVRKPPYFDGHAGASPQPVTDIAGARVLAMLGDSVTTDHISPAGSIKADSPAGRYLIEHGVERRRLQLLRLAARQPRGDDPRHVRQHPAAQPARPRRRGRLHRRPARRRAETTIYDAAQRYRAEGVPLVVLAGKEYGSGLLARLGGQGHGAARRARGDRRVLRAHPPLQPDRHGRPAAAVPATARPRSRWA